MRKVKDDTDCADCLCRVCARNENNDAYNSQVDIDQHYCQGCDGCHEEVIETEEDCPSGSFLPDEDDVPDFEPEGRRSGTIYPVDKTIEIVSSEIETLRNKLKMKEEQLSMLKRERDEFESRTSCHIERVTGDQE